ncbi:transposase [Dolichospermum sp. LEGE 00246]|uniref:transposase n=1 Tax=Dolichospermum sp. LEGE 00246 TaxID=1828605 RepID=UPI001D13E325|nr:transposase [Dolichospermum sp. LEGE 00246]
MAAVKTARVGFPPRSKETRLPAFPQSPCGYKWGKLDLKIRSVKCLNCGTEHDRDENAAKNINKACTEPSRSVGIGHCHNSKRAQRQSKTSNG